MVALLDLPGSSQLPLSLDGLVQHGNVTRPEATAPWPGVGTPPAQQAPSVVPPTLHHGAWAIDAAAMVGDLAQAEHLSAARAAKAREIIGLLELWKVMTPTEIGDPTDGDFTLIWRRGGLVASLTLAEDEVLGYAYKPTMTGPWILEQAGINVAELNSLARIVGDRLGA